MDENGSMASLYAVKVGARLRAERKQKGLPLHAAEEMSGQEPRSLVPTSTASAGSGLLPPATGPSLREAGRTVPAARPQAARSSRSPGPTRRKRPGSNG
jgi:hypothetical protein